jgi:hypothetical protein
VIPAARSDRVTGSCRSYARKLAACCVQMILADLLPTHTVELTISYRLVQAILACRIVAMAFYFSHGCAQAEPEFRERAYVTDEDIKALDNFNNKTVLAIKAPKGTKMALPYPDENAEEPPGCVVFVHFCSVLWKCVILTLLTCTCVYLLFNDEHAPRHVIHTILLAALRTLTANKTLVKRPVMKYCDTYAYVCVCVCVCVFVPTHRRSLMGLPGCRDLSRR